MKEKSKELSCAINAAKEAGRIILGYYQRDDFTIEKGEGTSGYEILTNADSEAQKIIQELLSEEFPSYGFIGEENYSKKKLPEEFVWNVDPIDNTKGFARKQGDFSVQIGLSYKQEAILGVVYFPASEELYYAQKGKGAWKRTKGKTKQIQVSTVKDLAKAECLASRRVRKIPKLQELYQELKVSPKLFGGAGKKICLIAEGKAELVLYTEKSVKEWDLCAPSTVLEEAKGKVESINKEKLLFNQGEKDANYAFPIIASNGFLQEEVQRILERKLKKSRKIKE